MSKSQPFGIATALEFETWCHTVAKNSGGSLDAARRVVFDRTEHLDSDYSLAGERGVISPAARAYFQQHGPYRPTPQQLLRREALDRVERLIVTRYYRP